MTRVSTELSISSDDIKPEHLAEFHALGPAHGVEVAMIDDEPFLELEVEATAYCTPFKPGRMYLANGDPGYPDEGGECEELTVTIGSKKQGNLTDLTDWLTDKSRERFEVKICDDAESDAKEARALSRCSSDDF